MRFKLAALFPGIQDSPSLTVKYWQDPVVPKADAFKAADPITNWGWGELPLGIRFNDQCHFKKGKDKTKGLMGVAASVLPPSYIVPHGPILMSYSRNIARVVLFMSILPEKMCKTWVQSTNTRRVGGLN